MKTMKFSTKEKKVPKEIFELFPTLLKKLSVKAGALSGGEQQMVALSRAIVQKPDILLLDEPSLGLSPKLVKEVFKNIHTLHERYGYTIIIVEHNILTLSEFADRAYVLEKGRVKKEVRDMSEISHSLIS